jgi:hypothetical protein
MGPAAAAAAAAAVATAATAPIGRSPACARRGARHRSPYAASRANPRSTRAGPAIGSGGRASGPTRNGVSAAAAVHVDEISRRRV